MLCKLVKSVPFVQDVVDLFYGFPADFASRPDWIAVGLGPSYLVRCVTTHAGSSVYWLLIMSKDSLPALTKLDSRKIYLQQERVSTSMMGTVKRAQCKPTQLSTPLSPIMASSLSL